MPVMKSDQATGLSGGTEVSSGPPVPISIRRLKFGSSPAAIICSVTAQS